MNQPRFGGSSFGGLTLDRLNSKKMEDIRQLGDSPDLVTGLDGLEVAVCHKCGEKGMLASTLRRDKKYSVSIGCRCGHPYSVIYDGHETIPDIVRLWNRYQHIHDITQGVV